MNDGVYFSYLFSFDSRGLQQGHGKHWPKDEEFGDRAYFKMEGHEKEDPVLLIEKIKDTDEGIYTCRVDFTKTPTMRTVTQLLVTGKTID